ncbi:MAG: flagellar protein, partial [Campylobacterota bacterium]|nr:flagellar protein [Campylobacterota bacterium]
NYKIKLFPMAFNLINETDVYQPNVKISKHWMIVGYKDKLPYIKNVKNRDKGLNLPFTMEKDMLPYVGGLDIKGNPVHLNKVQDVTDYLKIKKYYKNKKYSKCLNLINEVIYDYPNSLFKAELLFYQIRVYAQLNDYDNVIEFSKVYLREYSSDENVPEVLSLTANAYSKIGLNIDADYFFDRLFNEHEETVYAKWGYIYKGEMLESAGGATKAVAFYKKALKETESIEVAATAAYRLALFYSGTTDLKKSAKYNMKIVKAQPSFFMNEFKKSLDMLYIFAENEDYNTATAMAKVIIDEIDKKHDEYERLLRDRAIWLTKTEDKQEALVALNRYLNEYKDGDFEEEIQIAKDAMFFATSDDNLSIKLDKYNELISEYRDDTIGNKAVYEKAKLLLENRMYSDLLASKSSLLALDREKHSDIDSMILDAAIGSTKDFLKHNICQEALRTSNEYNITLSSKWDEKMYLCAEKGADISIAKNLIDKNLKSKNIDERKKWLYRDIKISFMKSKYENVIAGSQDLIILIEDDIESQKNREYKEIYRYIFDTYKRTSNSQKMLSTINKLQELFGITYKDIERYVAVIGIGVKSRDDNIIIKYATDVMNLQKRTASYTQSPYVEFTLYQAHISNEYFEKALAVINSLDSVDLSKTDRARQKYLLGSVYSKLWRDEEAQVAYQQSIDADTSSAWAKLAKSAKEI